MQIREYAVAMAAYNAWMNEKVYACAAGLSDEERKQDRGAAFKSVHGTLNHLLLADGIWLQRFRGETVVVKSLDQELHAEFADLWEARRATDGEITAWAEALTEEFGAGPFRFRSASIARDWELPGWAIVVHFFNHQTHHRGQVTTLLAQLGNDPDVTDFLRMPFFD